MFCEIEILINQKKIKTKAMIDTGNMLKEPISGKPVIVVEHTLLYDILPKEILNNLEKILGGDIESLPDEIKNKYISKLKIPKGLLGPKQYKFIFRVGIYNLRNCSYIDGVRFLVNVVYNSGFAGPYPADTFRASINNQLPWETTIVGDEEKPC